MIGSMGIGSLGNPTTMFTKKFRWTLEMGDGIKVIMPETFVKVSSRPNLTIEETELNYLNKMFIPGRRSWEDITVTMYEYDMKKDSWSHLILNQDKSVSGLYAVLRLYDGCGVMMEEWKLRDVFITAVNFGEMDHSSSEAVTLELTLRYSDTQYHALTDVSNNTQQKPIFSCGISDRDRAVARKVKAYLPSFDLAGFE